MGFWGIITAWKWFIGSRVVCSPLSPPPPPEGNETGSMRKRKVLACDTSWGDGGGSGEGASLSGACAFGTVACSRKNTGSGVEGCDAKSTSPWG